MLPSPNLDVTVNANPIVFLDDAFVALDAPLAYELVGSTVEVQTGGAQPLLLQGGVGEREADS